MTKFRNNTRTDRWRVSSSYSRNWIGRSQMLLDMFLEYEYISGQTYKVAELGCGALAPFHEVCNKRENFSVKKFDIKKWDENTHILNLNEPNVALPKVDISVFAGVLEYLNDVPKTLKKAILNSSFLLISYSYVPSDVMLKDNSYLIEIHDRAQKHGWRNHYSNEEIVNLITNLGVISAIRDWNNNQSLFLIRNFDLDNK